MAENPQEQTEAKLLAYIEDELDESGRAEIERHIEANPKHRKLLDELSAGRRLLRLLPREVAPLDLYENVQSQLERQELLASVSTLNDGLEGGQSGNGYDVNPDTGNFRLGRWGRIRAAAAIALLASGLGIVAYNVSVPGNSRTVAVTGDLKTHGRENLAKADGSGFAGKALQPPVDNSTGTDDLRRLRMASAADHVRNLDEVRTALADDRDIDAGAFANPEPLRRSATDKTASVGGGGAGRYAPETSGHERFYLVVASGDPSSARDDVLSMLSEKGLTYSRVAMTPAMKARGLGERQLQGDMRGAGSADRNRADLKRAETADAPGAPAPDEFADKRAAKPAASSPANASRDGGIANNRPAPGVPAPMPLPEVSSTPIAQTEAVAKASPAVEEVVIVRRVPRSRAAELVAAMNRPAAARYAFAYGSDAIPSDPANSAAPRGGMLKQSFGAVAPNKPAITEAAKGAAAKDDAGGRDKGELADAAPKAFDPATPPAATPSGGVAMPTQEPAPAAQPKTAEGPPAAKKAEVAGAGEGLSANQIGKTLGDGAAEKSKAAVKPGWRKSVPAETSPPAPAAPLAAAAPTRPAIAGAVPGAAPGEPAAQFGQNPSQNAAPSQPGLAKSSAAQTEQRAAGPLAANDAIELVYLDMRVNGRPVTQPMRITAKGTIYVAGGIGEFALAGMSPAQAAEKLSTAMRARTSTSKGVEIRRSAAGLTNALAEMKSTDAPAALDPQARGSDTRPLDGMARREAAATGGSAGEKGTSAPRPAPTTPAPPSVAAPTQKPLTAHPAPMAKSSAPGNPAGPAELPSGDEDFVDLVIVVQRDVSEADSATPTTPER